MDEHGFIRGAFQPILNGMLAPSIREPYAELILRGIKTDFGKLNRVAELRLIATIGGERFFWNFCPARRKIRA